MCLPCVHVRVWCTYVCISVCVHTRVWRGACSWSLIWPVIHICVFSGPDLIWMYFAVQGSVPRSPSVRQGAPLAVLVSGLTARSVRPAPPGPARPRAISSRRAVGPQHRAWWSAPECPAASELSPLTWPWPRVSAWAARKWGREQAGQSPSPQRRTTGGPVAGTLLALNCRPQFPEPRHSC